MFTKIWKLGQYLLLAFLLLSLLVFALGKFGAMGTAVAPFMPDAVADFFWTLDKGVNESAFVQEGPSNFLTTLETGVGWFDRIGNMVGILITNPVAILGAVVILVAYNWNRRAELFGLVVNGLKESFSITWGIIPLLLFTGWLVWRKVSNAGGIQNALVDISPLAVILVVVVLVKFSWKNITGWVVTTVTGILVALTIGAISLSMLASSGNRLNLFQGTRLARLENAAYSVSTLVDPDTWVIVLLVIMAIFLILKGPKIISKKPGEKK